MRQVTGAAKPRSCADTPGFATGVSACSLAEAPANARSVGDDADRVEMVVEIWKFQASVGDSAGAGQTMGDALALAGAIEDVD